jgi:hypothetical protein
LGFRAGAVRGGEPLIAQHLTDQVVGQHLGPEGAERDRLLGSGDSRIRFCGVETIGRTA